MLLMRSRAIVAGAAVRELIHAVIFAILQKMASNPSSLV